MPGRVVDSAACFLQGPFWPDHLSMWRHDPARAFLAAVGDEARPRFCAAALEAPAFGFTRPMRDGAMEVQLHAITYQLAITPHQGETRLLGLTLWQHLVHSHVAPAVAAVTALLVGVGDLITVYTTLRPDSDAPPRRRRRAAATRRSIATLPPKETPP